ncbi:MAG: HRDC domain-containing protein [Planctomycetia bacterium]|nr:HRDC domain-containing protein [Planctomycetia bacterium]
MYKYITSTERLESWCRAHRDVEWIALDTEFIAEQYYEPLLCLIQVASPRGNYLLDPMSIRDISPFWELLAHGDHETIVHAGQSELGFCYRYAGRFPKNLFDVQTAAGFVGLEYPAGYTNLLFRVLGCTIPGTESRTNWKARPLTERQVIYALDDVIYLYEVRKVLSQELYRRRRQGWFVEEMKNQMAAHLDLFSDSRWRRLVRNTCLDPHGLAVVKELWSWREETAKRRNCAPRHVLRDDLIMEFARRKLAGVQSIRNVRGMERKDLQRHLPELAKRISWAISLPEERCPKPGIKKNCSRFLVVGQLLYTALGSICQNHGLAIGLVGTPSDVREWVAWRLDTRNLEELPRLGMGWRAQVVGKLFDDLLMGHTTIRIVDPHGTCPIDFADYDEEI